MKNYCLYGRLRMTLLLVCLSAIAYAQDTIMYRGGYHDGYTSVSQINFTPANLTSFVAYQGGSGDGYSAISQVNFTQSNLPGYAPYQGGTQDGYAFASINQFTPTLLTTQSMYLGATGDGYATAGQGNFTPGALTHHYTYLGGNGDGYTDGEQQQFTPSFLTHYTPYAGGKGDGYAGALIVGVVLPAQLLSFDGKATEKGNLLEWKVGMEKDLRSYELQRASDGIGFRTIYTKEIAANSSQKKSYDYLDTEMPDGDNYYRLQINELDDEKTYSNIVLLVYKKDQQLLSLYPNPAQDVIMLQYKLEGKIAMRITDVKGSVVSLQQLEPGAHTIRIPVAHLAHGMYVLQVISDANFTKSIRFIKQ